MNHSSNYDAIIIGAGIGGLTCGNILAKNGFKVLILEKNSTGGGSVTTFYRDAYPLDITHCLCAMNKGGFIQQMFEYLSIDKLLELVELDKVFIYFNNPNNHFSCYTDLNKYKEELQKNFVHESNNIERLFGQMKDIWKNELLNSYYNPSFLQLITYPFLFPRIYKYRNFTFDAFLGKYIKTTLLKDIISVGWPYLGLERKSLSALYMLCLMGAHHCDRSYFVKGGFGTISKILVENFRKLGGNIVYQADVTKILVDDKKRAYGVKDKKGNNYFGKNIISNIDSKRTFLSLLDQETLDARLLRKIKELNMSCSAIQVHIVANAEVESDFLSVGSILLSQPINLEEKLGKVLKLENHIFRKQTLMLSIKRVSDYSIPMNEKQYIFNIGCLPANYTLWSRVLSSVERKIYDEIKENIADTIISHIKQYWKINSILLRNVLTPISFKHWLGSTNGAIYDLACYPQQTLLKRFKNKTAIHNLYLVGAKTFPGPGIPGAIISASVLCDTLLDKKLTKGKPIIDNAISTLKLS